jgi:hypothetical protein
MALEDPISALEAPRKVPEGRGIALEDPMSDLEAQDLDPGGQKIARWKRRSAA